jgi:cation transport regulator ChaB
MPYNAKKPTKDLISRIKKKHPKATKKDIRKFIHVFNSSFKDDGDESKAFAKAWGSIKKSKKKKAYDLLEQLYKLANLLDEEKLFADADSVDEFIIHLDSKIKPNN